MLIQITRYRNRKLYDKAVSRYVTLDDIRNMIVEGNDVEIKSPDGEDWTSRVLAQVYLQLSSQFDSERLHNLIWEAA